MYNSTSRPQNGGRSRTGGRPRTHGTSSAPRRAHTGGKPRGGRPSYVSRRPARSRGGAKTARIDISRFINKFPIDANEKPFAPVHQFIDFVIHDKLKANIIKKGYVTPTPIQDGAIPMVLGGEDIVGIANTGTGKTAAFLIPLINKILREPKTRVLIMAPTRELAQQIEEEFWGFADNLRIGAVSCVGGAPIGKQISVLRRRPHMVIGTPGRLKDLVERGVLDLETFNTVVLDEADRMLDMGFIADMRQLLALMPEERQTLFFSATLSREIEALIGSFLHNPVRVSVSVGQTSDHVEQDIVRIESGRPKTEVLFELLAQEGFQKVLVFGRTKHGVEKLSKILSGSGFKSVSIHGNKTQGQRQHALSLFKEGRVQVLVATDVAARGIDVSDVSHVINYDLPTTYEDYVHRIGRTGRAGKRGKALTFIE